MNVQLRAVTRKDWDFILQLRNKKEFQSFFYEQHVITKKEHYDYLTKQKLNPNFNNWIIQYCKKDVGYLRILDHDVSIIIDEKFHQKNIGTHAIKLLEIEAKKLGIPKLIGRVMIHNVSSKKIFLKNKFKLKMYWLEKEIN